MRNLKRALSLALASVMLLGLMVVGAGAAGYEDFADKDEIQHSEAVKTLVTLNVINGKDDGNYDPKGSLTRAEMAKLITFVLNGGKDPVVSTKAIPTYSDIKGNWAEAYIEYCSSMGVIAGVGGGRFDPSGTLTGSQAAKMLLVAMNYDAKVFNFTGVDWEVNVNREANSAKLYDELEGMNPSATISRDDAAQLVYNAIQSKTMYLSWGQNMATGETSQNYNLTGPSLFANKFDGVVYEGVFTASGNYGIGGTTGKESLAMIVEKQDNSSVTPNVAKSFKWADTDLTSLVGQYVRLLYNTKSETIYGVYPVNAKNSLDITTTTNKVTLTDGKLKTDGVKYSFESGAIVYVDGAAPVTVSAASAYIASSAVAKADTIRLISNDGDDKVDVVLINTVAVAKVTYIGSDEFNVGSSVGSRIIAGNGVSALNTYAKSSQKLEDVDVPDDLAKNDYVILAENYYKEKDSVAKVELQEGAITGTKSGQWQIDGDWYKPYAGYTGLDSLDNGDSLNYVAINGIVYFAEKTTGNTVTDIAAVITAGVDNGSVAGVSAKSLQVKMLFSDGTKKTVAVSKFNGTKVEDATIAAQLTAVTTAIGDLVTYKIDNDGKYELTTIPAGSTTKAQIANYTRSLGSSHYTAATKAVGGYTLSDTAVVFVIHADTVNSADPANDGKLFTGKEIKRLAADLGDVGSSVSTTSGLVSTSNGIQEVAVAVLSTTAAIPSITGAGTSYGYLTSGTYRSTDSDNGKTYNVFTYWDGSDVVTAKEESNTSKVSYGAGQVIGFDTVSDGIIKNVALVGATGRVSGYNETKNEVQIYEANGTYKITNDTTILYVDSDAVEGRTGGGIALANDLNDDGTPDVNNVRYILNPGTNEAELLVVDVNNKFVGSSKASKSIAFSNVAAILSELTSYDAVEVTGAATLGDALTIPAGKTVTFSGTLDTNSKALTVNGTLALKDTVTGPALIHVTQKGTVNLIGGNACTATNVNAITFAADATLTVDSDIASGLTAVYTSIGAPTSVDSDNNPVAGSAGTTTASLTGSKTMVATTVYTSNNNATTVAWLVQ